MASGNYKDSYCEDVHGSYIVGVCLGGVSWVLNPGGGV